MTTAKPSPETVAKLQGLLDQAAAGKAEWFVRMLEEAGFGGGSRTQGVTATEIGRLFGVTRQAVGQWAKNEGCPRSKDGMFDLPAVVQWYIEREGLSADGKARLEAARLKKAEHEAEILEIAEDRKRLEFESERGLWMKREEVETGWARRARIVRDGLLRLAKELPPRLEHRPGREIQDVLEKRMLDLLNKYAGTQTDQHTPKG